MLVTVLGWPSEQWTFREQKYKSFLRDVVTVAAKQISP